MPKNISYVITAIDKFSGVAKDVSAAMAKIQKSIKDVGSSTKGMNKHLKDVGKVSKNASKDIGKFGKSSSKTLGNVKLSAKNIPVQFNAISKAAKVVKTNIGKVNIGGLSKIGPAASKIPSKISGISNAFQSMGSQISSVASKSQQALERIRQKSDKVSQGIGGIIGTFAAVGVSSGLALNSADNQLKVEAMLTNALGKKSNLLSDLATKTQDLTRFSKADIMTGQAAAAALLRQNFGFKDMEQILIRLTPLMADLAATTGQDLRGAAQQISESFMTAGAPIANLGIKLTATEKTALRLKQVMDGLKKTVGGNAEAMGKAGLGPAKILFHTLNDLSVEIGKALLPTVIEFSNKMKPIIANTSRWISENKEFIITIVKISSVVLGLIGSVLAFKLMHKGVLLLAGGAIQLVSAIKTVTTAFSAMGMIMAANPIGAVITGVALLAAGLVYAYKHSEAFRNIVSGVWKELKQMWRDVNALIDSIPGLSTAFKMVGSMIAPPIAMVKMLIDLFSQLSDKFQTFKKITGFMGKVGKSVSDFGKSFSKSFKENLTGMSDFFGGNPNTQMSVDNSINQPINNFSNKESFKDRLSGMSNFASLQDSRPINNIIPAMRQSKTENNTMLASMISKSTSDVKVSVNDPGNIIKDVSVESNATNDFNLGRNMAFGAG